MLRLRDLTDCSTFTLGDSNDATLTARFPRLAPIPLTSPSILAASSKTPSKGNNILIAASAAEACEQYGGYVEVQVHDGLAREHLVEIVYLEGGQPCPEVLELAKMYCPVRSVAGYDVYRAAILPGRTGNTRHARESRYAKTVRGRRSPRA